MFILHRLTVADRGPAHAGWLQAAADGTGSRSVSARYEIRLLAARGKQHPLVTVQCACDVNMQPADANHHLDATGVWVSFAFLQQHSIVHGDASVLLVFGHSVCAARRPV